MHPIIDLGFTTLPTYGLLGALSFICAVLYAMYAAKKLHIPPSVMLIASVFTGLGIVIGAKLVFFLVNLPSFLSNHVFTNPYMNGYQLLVYLFGGFVFYGGLIGGLIGFYIFCKTYGGIPFKSLINIVSPAIPLMHAIGRIGCIMGGCCNGINYNGPLSITIHGVNRFPVQLIEAFCNAIIFVIMVRLTSDRHKSRSAIGFYLVSYPIMRFLLEFLRGDTERGIFLCLSTSQWISLCILPIGVWLILKNRQNQ